MKKICLLAFILLGSCRKEKMPLPEYTLAGEEIVLPDNAALNFNDLFLNEAEHCILKAELTGDIALKKIYYEADSVANMFHRGRGPGEYLYLRIQQIDPRGNFLAIGALKGNVLYFTPSGEQRETVRIKSSAFNVVDLGERLVSYGSDSSMYRLWDRTGNLLADFGTYPDEKPCEGQYKKMAYQGKLLANPERNRFAFLCSSANVFEIYEIGRDDTPRPIFSIRESLPEYRLQKQVIGVTYTDCTAGYTDAYATARSIYALYSGKDMDHIRTDEDMRRAIENDRIEVYDWDGAHRCDLLLDRPILDFCVGSDDGFLIALYSDEGEMRFCKYDLAGIGIR